MTVPFIALGEPTGVIAALSAVVGNEASIALLFHVAVRGPGKSWWDPSIENKLRNVLKLSCRDTLWCLKDPAEILCLDVQVGIRDFGGFFSPMFSWLSLGLSSSDTKILSGYSSYYFPWNFLLVPFVPCILMLCQFKVAAGLRTLCFVSHW